MTRPSTILNHLNPSKITPSGWINSIGLLAWCGIGAFYASKLDEGLVARIGLGLVTFIVLAYVLAIWYSNDYDERYG